MRAPLLWILVAAVALRLLFAFGVVRGLQGVRPETEITDGYEQIAVHLFHGQGYRQQVDHPPTVQRPPGYPVFLWAIFRAAGVNYALVQVLQAFLGAVGCWVLYRFGSWVLDRRLGLAAALLYAIYPVAIQYSARLYAENLYFPLFLASAWILCRAVAGASAAKGALAGILFGLGLLTRGTLLAFPPFLLAGLPLISRARTPLRRVLRWMLPAAFCVVLAIAPWAARNYRLTGAVIPVSAWGWAPFYHGIQCSKAMLTWGDLESIDRAADRRRHEIVVERLYGGDRAKAWASAGEYVRHEMVARDLVLEEIRRDPLGFFGRGLAGTVFTWFQTLEPRKRVVSLLVHLPLMVLFVLGVRWMAQRQPAAFARAWPALLLVLFVDLFQGFVFPFARYMAPATALSFLWSGFALDSVLRRVRSCA